MKLNKYDLHWCVRRLPYAIRAIVKKEEIVVAGGYIRSCILNERINDIDLFIPDGSYAKEISEWLVGGKKRRIVETQNAITVKGFKYPVQFITRWTYDDPLKVLYSFDFTICQASFWWDHYCCQWKSAVSDAFYEDLAAKRLVYTSPMREEAPGGSILRILKYYQKGYRITIPSLSGVITRLAVGVNFGGQMVDGEGVLDAPQFQKIVHGLLREVDPNVDPDHVFEGDED